MSSIERSPAPPPPEPITVGSICTGYGGIELALDLAGVDHRLEWVSEIDPTASAVLADHWPHVPNIGDINDANPEPVDLITAGFPCQDISVAGQQAGIHGERSGLWWRIRDVVGDLRPQWVLLENVDAIRSGATDERTIRCLCGWPHRRGGLPVLEQEPDTLDRCRDDQDGEEPTGDDASRVRRHSQTAPSSDREVGRSVDMADQRPRMPSSGRTDRPACADQVRPMPTAAAIQGDPRRKPVDTNISEGSLDGRWTPASDSDPQTNPGVECERPRSGNGYRGLPCPSCSRDLGDCPEIVTRRPWLGEVLRSLTGMGYRVRWGVVRASDAGAPHQRARWFCLATNSDSGRLSSQWRRSLQPGQRDTNGRNGETPDTDSAGPQGRWLLPERRNQRPARENGVGVPADTNGAGGTQQVAVTGRSDTAVAAHDQRPTADADKLAGTQTVALGDWDDQQQQRNWSRASTGHSEATGRHGRVNMNDGISLSHGQTSQARSGQALSDVRQTDATQTVQWSTRRSDQVSESAQLLSVVRQHPERPNQIGISQTGRTAQEIGMPRLWDHEQSDHSPHRPGLAQQQTEQLGDVVQQVPHDPSLAGGLGRVEAAISAWGKYGPAVANWAAIIGRLPPPPVVNGRLNPRAVEWMMGLPDQWVNHGSRAAQLRCLGNGVVPQQAALALRLLADD